ncbi:MAG: type II toxin-antitoxin system RelE/ParE family toxin [Proteobacteria bacterium]|nr:type II toxin-antitoxin system RelE/ParE family toxin [Pseudomonadota bacterium]
MNISFKIVGIQKLCSQNAVAQKKLGAKMARKLQQRMMELKAAETLIDISKLPPARCHELRGNRKGQLSVDLEHPYRLLFVPAENPIPEKESGGLDWAQVTEIEIVGIVDTH